MCKDVGYNVDRTTIYDAVMEKEKENMQKDELILQRAEQRLKKEDEYKGIEPIE